MKTIVNRLLVNLFWFSRHKTGKNLQVVSPRLINCPSESLRIDNDFFAGPGLYLGSNRYCNVYIGSSVMFGPEVMLLGGNHDYSFTGNHVRYRSEHDESCKNIMIGNGAWVGGRTTILSGAEVGEAAIIGANALVNKSIPLYCIAAGNPAKPVVLRFRDVRDLESILENVGSELTISDINMLLPDNLKYEI
ncbi:MAG: acyltransferase [Gammaproteobacteria bacterium]|nr:acyltransferase [Gammaproteobacteria bacterium]